MNKFETSSCKQNTSNIVYYFILVALSNPAVNSISFYLSHTRSLEERKMETKSAVKEVNSNLLRMNNFWWKCGALARQLEITAWPYDTSQEWQSDLYKGHVFRELARGSNAVLEPRAIAKAPEGEGCPRCGGYVYAAEQMLARGRVSFHRIGHPIHFRDIALYLGTATRQSRNQAPRKIYKKSAFQNISAIEKDIPVSKSNQTCQSCWQYRMLPKVYVCSQDAPLQSYKCSATNCSNDDRVGFSLKVQNDKTKW